MAAFSDNREASLHHDLMNLASGTRLGPYEVIAPIGAGGMGEVWKAREPTVVKQKSLIGGDETVFLARGGDFQWIRGWSSDGGLAVYDQWDTKTGSDIWALPLTPGGKLRPLVQTRFNEGLSALSPDSRWLAFASDESGRSDVYAMPLNGGSERIQISVDGGSHPRWRGGGGELFHVAADRSLMAVPVVAGANFGTASKIVQLATGSDWWGGDLEFWSTPCDVTSDGQHFLLNTGRGWDSLPMTVVLIWTRKLEK